MVEAGWRCWRRPAVAFGLLLAVLVALVACLLAAGSGARADDAAGSLSGAVRPGFDATAIPGNDDGSTDLVPIGFAPNFFGNTYQALYVNNNGNLTFDAALGEYTPFDLTSTQQVIIAPFFGDVDTRVGNLAAHGPGTVDGHQAFGATWPNVGCFAAITSVLNYFQVVLIDRSDIGQGDFDIEFNYNSIQWEAGTASGGDGSCQGGSSARAGYSNGSGDPGTFFELPGSAVNGAFLDSNTRTGLIYNSLDSNVPGRYIFRVRGGLPQIPNTPTNTPPPTDTPTATQPGEPSATPTTQPPTASATPPAPASATATTRPPTATRTAVGSVTPTRVPTQTATPGPTQPAGPAVLDISSASSPIGDEAFIDLNVHGLGPPGLGGWAIDIHFDPDVAFVVACMPYSGSVCGVLGTNGDTVRVAGSSSPGIEGGALLATIVFACRGSGSSALLAQPVILLDGTSGAPQALGAAPGGGTLTCIAPPPPTATNVPPLTDTPTPLLHATGTPAAKPTPTASPVPTRSSEVLGNVNPTPGGTGSGRSSSKSRVQGSSAGPRPRTTGVVPSPGQLSTSAKVIGSNIFLALILLLILLFTSSLFNGTVDENRREIDAFAARLTAPFRRFRIPLNRPALSGLPGFAWLGAVIGPLAILLLTGLVYSLNEPGWGFNDKSLVLFLAVVIAAGILTYVYEGGEALLHRTRFGTPAGVKLVPVALVVSVGFVVLSRLVNFQAPIMYGFIAASTLLVPATLDRRQSALGALVPATALLVLSLVAWSLVGPLRAASSGSNHWWSVLPSSIAVMLFAGGIEGLLFVMIPLKFLDGTRIWEWNRLLWVPVFAIPAFLFCWVILNPQAQGFDALIARRVITALSVTGGFAVLTLIVWCYFYMLHRREAEAVEA